jgi:ABC-type antimicrobial peptide transport system permease subunit
MVPAKLSSPPAMRLAARQLLRASGLTALAIATLATGIASNSALLGGAATLLIFIICWSNMSTMLLARGVDSRHEITVRRSLLADRQRLVRRLLGENLLLALVASALGTLLALWANEILASIMPPSLDASPRVTTLALSVAATVVTTLAFGVLPALDATRTNLAPPIE